MFIFPGLTLQICEEDVLQRHPQARLCHSFEEHSLCQMDHQASLYCLACDGLEAHCNWEQTEKSSRAVAHRLRLRLERKDESEAVRHLFLQPVQTLLAKTCLSNRSERLFMTISTPRRQLPIHRTKPVASSLFPLLPQLQCS